MNKYSAVLKVSFSLLVLCTTLSSLPPTVAEVSGKSKEYSKALCEKGMKQMDVEAWLKSVDFFDQALKADPENDQAKRNLAIAYSNYGLLQAKAKAGAEGALKYFHYAILLYPQNNTMRENLDSTVGYITQKDPRHAATRIAIAESCESKSDVAGAIAEYREALRYTKAPDVSAKLHKLETSKEALSLPGYLLVPSISIPASIWGLTSSRDPKFYTHVVFSDKYNDEDYTNYFTEVAKQLKASLSPLPKLNEAVIPSFEIKPDGTVGNAVFYNMSSNEKADMAILKKIRAMHIKPPAGLKVPMRVEALIMYNLGTIRVGMAIQPSMKDYADKADERIRSLWDKPVGTSISVMFAVDTTGNASEIRIMKSSGSKEEDARLLKAVSDGSPYGSIPAGSPEAVNIRLNYGVKRPVGSQDEKSH